MHTGKRYIGRKAILNSMLPVILVLLSACSDTQRPNVVFVLADQWRAQDLGFAGNTQVLTPALDQLAGESLVFTNAISNLPACSPARASLMTGKYPLHHGVFYNDKPLAPDEHCLAEVFRSGGYRTAYIGKWHINGHDSGLGLHQGRNMPVPEGRRQGFDLWKVHECTHNYNNSVYYDEKDQKHIWEGYDAIAQTREALDYIRSNRDDPFLLFLSWGPPHAPYGTAPEKFRKLYQEMEIDLRPNVPDSLAGKARQDIKGYYAHISALDHCIALIQDELKAQDLEDHTIFVFSSDHGDMLYSHGETKKQKPWEESILVPFMLKYPARVKGGRMMTKMFSFPDIMPTLLGLCGLKIPGSVQGLDYSGQILGTEDLDIEEALLTCPVPFHQWSYLKGGREYRGIRTEDYTYVKDLGGPWLLYDNSRDPYQMNNLCDREEYRELQAELEDRLQQVLKKRGDEFLGGEEYMKIWNYGWDNRDSIRDLAQNQTQ